jgi:hypothetical protein
MYPPQGGWPVKKQTLSAEKVPSAPLSLDTLTRLAILTLTTLCTAISAIPLAAQEKPSSGALAGGLFFNAEASAKDVGLLLYPGAQPHTEKEDDKASAKFGLWGNAFAFKLAVLKLESGDPAEKVAAFYKKALAKFRTVLDCGMACPPASDRGKSGSSKELACANDKPEPGTMMFKAGTKEKQHAVAIQPNGRGSVFQLVSVESPDSDKNKNK